MKLFLQDHVFDEDTDHICLVPYTVRILYDSVWHITDTQ